MRKIDEPLQRAIKNVGRPIDLARLLGISPQAVAQWSRVPPMRVIAVESKTGVPRCELRPDIYPPPEKAA